MKINTLPDYDEDLRFVTNSMIPAPHIMKEVRRNIQKNGLKTKKTTPAANNVIP
jgi:hypothetical protein